MSLLLILSLVFLLSWNVADAGGDDQQKAFVQCLSNSTSVASNISNIVYPSDNPSFSSILEFSIRNRRFDTPTTPKPLVIVTPRNVSHIQSAVLCAQSHNLQLRVRSGGHDYEGLSYVSPRPFVVLDLIQMSNITVDAANQTAWVQSGATVGQVYAQVGKSSNTLAFPASVCHTVGIGGIVSGGGYGTLLRYAGLAADHVADVQVVDARGRVRDRASLGEDVFWAIRGGGGNTFGIVVAWKFNLVTVPETVTMFSVTKTLEQGPTKYLAKWQKIADALPNELLIRIVMYKAVNPVTIAVVFNCLYVGSKDKALSLIQESFPELGVTPEVMFEMTWAQSTIQFAGINGTTLDSLESRTPVKDVTYFKAKSDYVTKPIPDSAMDGLLKMMMQDGIEQPYVIFTPYGGKMAEIASNSIPFPHREGNLFKIQYLVYWKEDSEEVSNAHMKWIRDVYDYMGSYVSSNPRAAYMNYRDLDIGENMNSSTGGNGTMAYQQAKVWGVKYFKGNFERLVKIKTAFDPTNFFSNEQSIPSLGAGKEGQTTSSNNSSPASAPSGDSDGGNNAGNETQSGDNNAGNGTQSGDVGQGDNNNNNNGTQIGGVLRGDNGNSTTQTIASVVIRYGPRSYYYLVLLFLVLFV
ncbi:unnamed protein product [Linum trigynum]|uniref:FAD-binding PCMH-type domain-containing protein n=1 Tax=Linum trigynum TaxID=586398 RepID=A0AAV2GIF2_9ROSI